MSCIQAHSYPAQFIVCIDYDLCSLATGRCVCLDLVRSFHPPFYGVFTILDYPRRSGASVLHSCIAPGPVSFRSSLMFFVLRPGPFFQYIVDKMSFGSVRVVFLTHPVFGCSYLARNAQSYLFVVSSFFTLSPCVDYFESPIVPLAPPGRLFPVDGEDCCSVFPPHTFMPVCPSTM